MHKIADIEVQEKAGLNEKLDAAVAAAHSDPRAKGGNGGSYNPSQTSPIHRDPFTKRPIRPNPRKRSGVTRILEGATDASR